MTEPVHGGHLVPVRVDPISSERSVLCALDEEMWAVVPDGWALWCPACGSLVTDILPGSRDVPDLESAPASVSDPYWRAEMRLASEHAAECAAQDPDLADFLTLAAWGVQE